MSEKTMTLQKYDSKYDLVKFVLSTFILAIHTAIYPMILYPWLRLAVPLFFIISSYFVFSKMHNASQDEQKKIIKKFVLRNIQLYLCWFIILLPMTLYLRKGSWFSNGLFENLLTIIKSVLFRSTFVASWFITASIFGVLIIYWLSKLFRKDFIVFLISLVTFCFVTLFSNYSSVISGTFIAVAIEKYIDIFGELVCSFPTALFWVFIGKMFAEQRIKIKSFGLLLCLIAVSCLALFLEWKLVLSMFGTYNHDSYFMLAPLCIFLFLGIQKIKPIYWNYSIHFKRASTIIYVSHGSLIPIVNKLLKMVFENKNELLTFIITLLCCIMIYIFIEIAIKICPSKRINKIFKMLY